MPEGELQGLDSKSLLELLGGDEFDALKQEVFKKISSVIKNLDKTISDPLGIGKTAKEFKNDVEQYRKKVKESLNMKDLPDNPEQKKDNKAKKDNPIDKIKDTSAASVLPQSLENAQKPQQEDGEQKTLGPKVEQVEFSDKTQSFFKGILKNVGFDEKMQGEFKKYFKDSLEKQDQILANTKQEGFLGMIGKLLALGGVATLLVTAFWDKIKPWLENTVGTKLDFLDKFKGIAEGIGKFFTMGGLKIAFGGITNLVGKAFTSFGDLIESVLKGAIKMILPAAEGVGEGAAAATKGGGLFKGLLPKIAGGLFKGIGATVLKGIPLIGSLISFYFAYDRFKNSDYIGAVIDLVGGLANLLEFTPLAPLALPVSLGAAALNAFLDYKSDGAKGEEGQKSKLGAITGIFTGLGNMLMKIPFIASLVAGVTGPWDFITSIISGDIGGMQIGLNGMKNIPIFAPIASFFENILAAGTPTNATAGGAKFSASSLMDSIKKKVGKAILGWFSWLPSWLKTDIANFMGIPLDSKGEIIETPATPPAVTPQQLAQDEIEKRKKALEASKATGQQSVADSSKPENTQQQTSSSKNLEQQKTENIETVKQKTPEADELDLNSMLNPMAGISGLMEKFSKIDISESGDKKSNLDYQPTSKEIPKILEDKTDVKYEPVKQDLPPKSTDPDVLIQKSNESTNLLLKAVQSLVQVLKEGQENPIPINVSGGSSGSSSSGKDYLFTNQTPDPGTIARSNWWGHSERIRATI